METLNLFESFVLWMVRHKNSFTISTGIVYGHKICKQGRYQFTEIDDKAVNVECDDFNYTATSLDELIKLSKAIKN